MTAITPIQTTEQLLTAFRAALIISAFAPLNTALANIQTNPTVENVAAQSLVAKANLVAILPGLKAVGISDIAQLVQNKLIAIEKLAEPSTLPAAPATDAAV